MTTWTTVPDPAAHRSVSRPDAGRAAPPILSGPPMLDQGPGSPQRADGRAEAKGQRCGF